MSLVPSFRLERSQILPLLQRDGQCLCELGAAIVAAPLLIFPSRFSIIALLLLPAMWIARLVSRRDTLRRTDADLPLTLLLVSTSLSLLPSVDLSLSRSKLDGLILGFFVYSLSLIHI